MDWWLLAVLLGGAPLYGRALDFSWFHRRLRP